MGTMNNGQSYPPPDSWVRRDGLNHGDYDRMVKEAQDNPDLFWSSQAGKYLSWKKEWRRISCWDFNQGAIRWFEGGILNAAENCIDRHLSTRAGQIAIQWVGDSPEQQRSLTYQQLYEATCRFASGLISRGIGKGDRVCIYMPMLPEAVVAMLACARIGAIHTVVFAGFSSEALKDRILDAQCCAVITADEGLRSGRKIALKAQVDAAVAQCPAVHTVVMYRHTQGSVSWDQGRDIAWDQLIEGRNPEWLPQPMNAEDPLFILYTSGSTGKPKGVLHTTAGYLLFCAYSYQLIFDPSPTDVFWCTADIGWVTGHTYTVYAPLLHGGTTLIYEGVPIYPQPDRFWRIIDQFQVTQFYTAPTALRALVAYGDEPLAETSRQSLRILGTVGEPINPETWRWYFHKVGRARCPVVDTWWQTETGGAIMTPLPGIHSMKPGSAMKPLPGVEPALVDVQDQFIEGAGEGALVLKSSWPGQMRTVYGDHHRFVETYFSQYPGCYFTGDGARRDDDGDICLTGRMDDVLNVSGHRIGTSEIEGALLLHPQVIEAAVVGFPHEIKGQGVHAYVRLLIDAQRNEGLTDELKQLVRREIGGIAVPDRIQVAEELPKTRSGKIMRRILRKIAQGDSDWGDLSTVTDTAVPQNLFDQMADIDVRSKTS